MLPDYGGGSLLNLMASLAAARGATPRHPPLAALPPAKLADARNVVLLLVDGLGDGLLARHAAGGEIHRRRLAAITSVFPSTTASAITTSYTGCAPLEHGLTGWFTFFGAAGCVGAPLPFLSRGDKRSLRARGLSPERAFAAGSLFDTLAARAIVVTPQSIVDSDYNRFHCGRAERRPYTTLDGLVAETEAAVKSGDERKLIYAYWPDYDTSSHQHGYQSPAALAQLAAVDAAFGALLARLAGTDSIVVLSADHGFVDVADEEALDLADAPGLSALLRYPLCGEPRVAYCYVQAGRIEAFMQRAADWLGARASVRPSAQLVTEGWFGPGAPHPRLAERIGDVALVMNGRYTIRDRTPGEARHRHIGNHGGTSEDEMRVPLVVATV
ncbi:MAG TPA: alkaline phosphatase family protein [Burkholderiales bacterium]|nr:alkaline phosphatase family protein [Burkholderiales bacterium]